MSKQKTSKHTPGPWKAIRYMRGDAAIYEANKPQASPILITGSSRSIDVNGANLDLIVRAPELLERVAELETENAKLVIRAGFDNKNAMEAAVDATKSNLSQRALIRKLQVVVEAAKEATYTCSPATKEKIETALEVLEAHNEPKKDRG